MVRHGSITSLFEENVKKSTINDNLATSHLMLLLVMKTMQHILSQRLNDNGGRK